jgi:DNA-binding GntR family transcriptional regulator
MADFRTEYQKVYEAIRNAIMNGEFVPGQRLPQRRLAERYGATTITVREALRFLEQDGLIAIEPKWGAMVVEITPERIRGRYLVREALEGMAARLAAESLTEADRAPLVELAERCDRELVAEGLTRHEKANLHYALHERIVKTTRCRELIESITRNNLHTVLLSNAYHIDWQHDDPHRHRTLVQSILSGDPDRAEATMRAHVRDGYRMELKALEKGKGEAHEPC